MAGSGDTFKVKWHPFLLRAEIPMSGMSTEEYFRGRMPPSAFAAAKARLADVGRSVGIEFKFRDRYYPTALAHALVEFAETKGKQDQVMEAVFHEYFELATKVHEIDELVRIAVENGLDERETREYLSNPSLRDRIVAESAAARDEKGISGVPFFEISNDDNPARIAAFSGAQPPDTFIRTFAKL